MSTLLSGREFLSGKKVVLVSWGQMRHMLWQHTRYELAWLDDNSFVELHMSHLR